MNSNNTLTLNRTLQNLKSMFKRSILYLPGSIFMIALITSMTAMNVSPTNAGLFASEDNTFVIAHLYAQSNPSTLSPNELQQLAKDYLSTLAELRNQSNTNASSLIDQGNTTTTTTSNEVDLAAQQFKTDVSGNYRSPTYGILDFVIPAEWYGSERQWSGDKSISLDMHAGTEEEYMDQLLSPTSVDGCKRYIS